MSSLPSLRSRSWDELWLGGTKFPGIATVGGPGIKRKLDIKNAKGSAGASMEDEGDELGQINISLLLTTDAQKDEFVALMPDISPRRKGGPKSPLEIVHPLANVLGIVNIYIDSVPIFDHDKRAATLTVNLHAYEWVPKPKPQSKGTGKGGAGSGTVTTDDVTSAIQDYLDKVREEFNSGGPNALDGVKGDLANG